MILFILFFTFEMIHQILGWRYCTSPIKSIHIPYFIQNPFIISFLSLRQYWRQQTNNYKYFNKYISN
jgi:hypothetical protein